MTEINEVISVIMFEKGRLVNTITVSSNAIMGQMAEMSLRKKKSSLVGFDLVGFDPVEFDQSL